MLDEGGVVDEVEFDADWLELGLDGVEEEPAGLWLDPVCPPAVRAAAVPDGGSVCADDSVTA